MKTAVIRVVRRSPYYPWTWGWSRTRPWTSLWFWSSAKVSWGYWDLLSCFCSWRIIYKSRVKEQSWYTPVFEIQVSGMVPGPSSAHPGSRPRVIFTAHHLQKKTSTSKSSQKLLKSNICKLRLKEHSRAASFSTLDKPLKEFKECTLIWFHRQL